MNTSRSDSLSTLLKKLFSAYGKASDESVLLGLSARYCKAFSDSQIPDERGVVSSLRGIFQQGLLNEISASFDFEQCYGALQQSQTTNPRTRSWMLYLLLTLYFQKKSVSISSFSIPSIPTGSPLFAEGNEAREGNKVKEDATAKKGTLTLPIAEPLLIQDIIASFQGINSKYFSYNEKTSLYEISPSLVLPAHIRNSVLRLLQIGSLYKRIRLMMEETKSEEHGIIRNSVNDNINKQLYQFCRFVISLEELNNKSIRENDSALFSMQKLVYQCEAPLDRLTCLYNIMCCSINLRGGALASSIFTFTHHGGENYRSLSMNLLSDINAFMLKQSWEWAVNGRLLDIHAEFFVEIAIPGYSVSAFTNTKEYNKWRDAYHYRHRMIPSFFPQSLVEKIFRCGKSIHYIRDALQDTKWCVKGCDLSTLSQCSIRDYSPLETLLDSVYEQAQSHIITVYKEKYQMMHMIRLFQEFYLLGAGDFYLEFITRVDYGFLHNRSEVSDGWLQEEFNNCINRVSLCSQSTLIANCLRLKHLQTLSVFDIWKSPFFSITQNPNMDVIFSSSIIQKYEKLFSALMVFKTQSFTMERIWNEQCILYKEIDRISDSAITGPIRNLLNVFNLLRMKIQHFLTSFQNFFFLHVIDKLYKSLLLQLQDVKELDKIIDYHESYVNQLCMFCFVDNAENYVNDEIQQLLLLSSKYGGLHNQFNDCVNIIIDKLSNQESVSVEVAYIEKMKESGIMELNASFTQCIQQLIQKLRNPPKGYSDYVTISSQLNFNYFYSDN